MARRRRNSRKPSFFERLTGTINLENEEFDDYEEVEEVEQERPAAPQEKSYVETEEEGQLAIDMYQTPSSVVIQTMVAGVHPEDLDISITREMVTIRGRREGPRGIDDGDYFHRELYWGAFSRSIVLPSEIEVEESEAVEDHGLLIITLPKIDKARQTKLAVKAKK